MHFPETTGIQKILIACFILIIISSAISLLLFAIEKPEKRNMQCEPPGRLTSIIYGDGTIPVDGPIASAQPKKNCTITINPPMSPVHSAINEIITWSGIGFVGIAIGASVLKKKDKEPIDIPNPVG